MQIHQHKSIINIIISNQPFYFQLYFWCLKSKCSSDCGVCRKRNTNDTDHENVLIESQVTKVTKAMRVIQGIHLGVDALRSKQSKIICPKLEPKKKFQLPLKEAEVLFTIIRLNWNRQNLTVVYLKEEIFVNI